MSQHDSWWSSFLNGCSCDPSVHETDTSVLSIEKQKPSQGDDPETDEPAMLPIAAQEPEDKEPEEKGIEDKEEIVELVRPEMLEEWRRQTAMEYNRMITESRRMHAESFTRAGPANRYGELGELPAFKEGRHVPTLALINPMSGAAAGMDILQVARRCDYYKERFFNIIDVVKGQHRGGLLDVFRIELCKAKAEAQDIGMRPRLISGGGDGTGSFAIFMIFLALKADSSRAHEGLEDTGNGFIWTDEEMAESFPAIAQMPLGSANDFGNILGWGQKYPGDVMCGSGPCGAREAALYQLQRWISAVIDPKSRIVNFDVWGFMPPKGSDQCNFKLAELTGQRGRNPNRKIDGKHQVVLKQAGKPVPFFVCLYFSAGIGAYMTSRFQINRRKTPLRNRAEYVRQLLGIVLESNPPQLAGRLNGVTIDCEDRPYFPPRRHLANQGRKYREVGFYNINWQAHGLHGKDRAPLGSRLCGCCASRQPVTFNDGKIDMFRWKFASFFKNPGVTMQTDKKEDMLLTFSAGAGKGVFFQWDGESRFAFNPKGEDFQIFIRKVLNVPVVIGPWVNTGLTGNLDNGDPVSFSFCGRTPEEVAAVKRRALQAVSGHLDAELNASAEELQAAGMHSTGGGMTVGMLVVYS
ncbi:Hypothetical protein SCF082_LOCUS43616 [Durusdinium trenchii]